MRKQLVLGLAVLAALALVAIGLQWWQSLRMNDLQRAISLAPADAQRLTFTDWAGVRRELDPDLGADSSMTRVDTFLADAFTADLSSMSSLVESTRALHEEYGFSPALLEWELLSQSEAGSAVLMRLAEDTDMGAIADQLERLGYQRPEEDTGVWLGGVDLLPKIGIVTPNLQYLAIDADQQLVVGSNTEGYLRDAMSAVTGDTDSVEGFDAVVEAVGQPLAAAIYDGPVACGSLAMGAADPGDQDQAEELIAAAGTVNPMSAFVMADVPDSGVRVAMSFESDDQARANADARAALASGPAPGQGGDFPDRFQLGRVAAEGSLVTMELEPREGEYLLSDLTSGPVLFATC